jgi:phytoene dehydrogenase-like protein
VRKADFFDADRKRVIQALNKLDVDTDMTSFLSQHFSGDGEKQLYSKVKGFVEGYDAADMNRVSARALKEEWAATDDAHQFRVEGGYLTVVRHLEEIVKTAGGVVVLSSPVTDVRWTRGKAEVFTETGKRFKADKVIITAPLGVLQNDAG